MFRELLITNASVLWERALRSLFTQRGVDQVELFLRRRLTDLERTESSPNLVRSKVTILWRKKRAGFRKLCPRAV